jgi:hypothetical protein
VSSVVTSIVVANSSVVCQFEAFHVYSSQTYSFSRDKRNWLDSGWQKIGLSGITLLHIPQEIPILLVVIKESVMLDIAVFYMATLGVLVRCNIQYRCCDDSWDFATTRCRGFGSNVVLDTRRCTLSYYLSACLQDIYPGEDN